MSLIWATHSTITVFTGKCRLQQKKKTQRKTHEGLTVFQCLSELCFPCPTLTIKMLTWFVNDYYAQRSTKRWKSKESWTTTSRGKRMTTSYPVKNFLPCSRLDFLISSYLFFSSPQWIGQLIIIIIVTCTITWISHITTYIL